MPNKSSNHDVVTTARDLFTVLAAFLDQKQPTAEGFAMPWLAGARELAAAAAEIRAKHGNRYDAKQGPCRAAADYAGIKADADEAAAIDRKLAARDGMKL